MSREQQSSVGGVMRLIKIGAALFAIGVVLVVGTNIVGVATGGLSWQTALLILGLQTTVVGAVILVTARWRAR